MKQVFKNNSVKINDSLCNISSCALLRVFYSLLAAKTDKAFKTFLDARNPTKQHSSTLESYLIKPVQRVLKYPLLLKELVSLTDHESEEHYHLTGKAVSGAACPPCLQAHLFSHVEVCCESFVTTVITLLGYNFHK